MRVSVPHARTLKWHIRSLPFTFRPLHHLQAAIVECRIIIPAQRMLSVRVECDCVYKLLLFACTGIRRRHSHQWYTIVKASRDPRRNPPLFLKAVWDCSSYLGCRTRFTTSVQSALDQLAACRAQNPTCARKGRGQAPFEAGCSHVLSVSRTRMVAPTRPR